MIRHLICVGFVLAAVVWPTNSAASERPSSGPSVNLSTGQLGGRVQAEREHEMTTRRIDNSTTRLVEDAPVPDYRVGASADERSLAWDGLRMVLMLAMVLLLLGLAVKLLRRWPGLAGRDGLPGSLQVLARVALTPKEAICLVRVGAGPGGEVLVLGVSPSGVTLLTRLEAGIGEATRTPGGAESSLRFAGQQKSCAARLRNLAAHVREVQAAWRIGGAPHKGDR
jgi:flagellar biogenesis protein FliO